MATLLGERNGALLYCFAAAIRSHPAPLFSCCSRAVPRLGSCGDATVIVIDGTVVAIPEWTFARCTDVTAVDFSNASALEEIGNEAFSGLAESMPALDFSGASKLHTVGEQAFAGLYQLAHVTLTPSLTSIASTAFRDSSTTLGVAGVVWNGVICNRTGLAGAFPFTCPDQACSVASTIDTCEVNAAAAACDSTTGACCAGSSTSVVFDNTVVDIGASLLLHASCAGVSQLVFRDATALERILTVPVFQRGPFRALPLLTSVDLRAAEKLWDIGNYAFAGCTALARVWLPNSVLYVREDAFTGTALDQESKVDFGDASCNELVYPFCPQITPAFPFACSGTCPHDTEDPTAAPTSAALAPTAATRAPTMPTIAPSSAPTNAPTNTLGLLVRAVERVDLVEGAAAVQTVVEVSTASGVLAKGEIGTLTCKSDDTSAASLADSAPIDIYWDGTLSPPGRAGFGARAVWDTLQLASRSTTVTCTVRSSNLDRLWATVKVVVAVQGIAQPSVGAVCTLAPGESASSATLQNCEHPSTNGNDTIVVIGGTCPQCPQPPFDATTVVSVLYVYRYILRESCSQFDSLPLTSLTIPGTS